MSNENFFFSFSDLLLCPNPDGIYCEQHSYEACKQIKNANFNNYGCRSPNSYETSYFECTNRMDKKDFLFNIPPIPKMNDLRAIVYNDVLSFDDSYIYCGKFNFSYEDFYFVRNHYGSEECQLINGQTIQIIRLWIDLITDFSFKMTKKMNEL